MAKPGPKPGSRHSGMMVSGDPRQNAGGRPKDEREWKAWCKDVFNKEDIRRHVLERMRENDNVLMWLGEQANGRATQAIEHKVDGTVRLRRMSVAELEAEMLRELKSLREVSSGT
jgi:hypothetical protein